MKVFGTLKGLDVKPGDVVQYKGQGYFTAEEGKCLKSHQTGISSKYNFWDSCKDFHIVSLASDNPKLWRDMTDVEKGALLLAHHEGKVIEVSDKTGDDACWTIITEPSWWGGLSYRVRPEPKVETVTLQGSDIRLSGFIKGHRITFNTVDGKPDCASIKMEEL